MSTPDTNIPPARGQSSTTVIMLLLVILLVIGAFGFAILGFVQRGEAVAALEVARTEFIVREQAALLTADAYAQNAQHAAATAVAALNIANDANNTMGTQAAHVEAAEATVVAMSTLAAGSDLVADEALNEAATADARVSVAQNRAATANSIAATANAVMGSMRNNMATAEVFATAAGRSLFIATAVYGTGVARATDVGEAYATVNVLAVQSSNLGATLTSVSSQVARLSSTATAVAESAAAVVQGPTSSPNPTLAPGATGTPVITEAGIAFPGERQGLVPPEGIEVWTYVGLRDEVLTITAEADFDIIITLFSTDDTVTAFGRNQGRENYNRIENFTLPHTGSYVIFVSGFLRQSHGPYTLTIESSRLPGVGSSSLATAVPTERTTFFQPTATTTASFRFAEAGVALKGENTGEVLVGGTEVWFYVGEAGEALTISLDADWDTTLTLVDSDFKVLASNDDIQANINRQSRVELMLERTAVYYILVGSFDDKYGGPYKMIIESDLQGF